MKAARVTVCALILAGMAAAAVRAEPKDSDRFRLSVDARAEYTDNRDSVPDNAPAGAPDWLKKASTFDFYVKPRGDVYLDNESTLFDLYYAPSVRYRTNPNDWQNDWELLHELGLSARHKLTPRLTGRVSDQFYYTDDPSISQNGATLRPNMSYYLNDARAGLAAQVGKQSTLDVNGGYWLKRYKETLVRENSDEDRADVGAGYRVQLANMMSVEARAGYSTYTYKDVVADAVNFSRDFDSIFVGGGVEKVFSQNLRGGVLAGAQFQQYDDQSIDSATTPYAQIYVRGSTVPALRLNGAVTHAVRNSDAYPYASQEYTEVRAGADWDATPKITLGGWGAYHLSNYDKVMPAAAAAAALGLLPASPDETTYELGIEATYRLCAKSSIRLQQRFEDRSSDIPVSWDFPALTRDYTKNTTALVYAQQF